MTLLVGGILLGLGVPNVMEFQRNGWMIKLRVASAGEKDALLGADAYAAQIGK